MRKSTGRLLGVTAMTTKASKLTFEEWQNLPETKERYDIVDGVMYMAPGATYLHQLIQQQINLKLASFILSRELGQVLTAPLDILIQRDPLRTRQPDILYLNVDKVPGVTIEETVGITHLEVAPDVAVEILSPSNTIPYLELKLRDYQAIGVAECWIFDPSARSSRIIDLTGTEPAVVATFGSGDTFHSNLLPGFELNLAEIFR